MSRSLPARSAVAIVSILSLAAIVPGTSSAATVADQDPGARISLTGAGVLNLVRDAGLSTVNQGLLSDSDPVRDDLASLPGSGAFRASLAAVLTGTGRSVGDEVRRRLVVAERDNTDSGAVELYVKSLRLADGRPLFDVVAPALVYSRDQQVREDNASPLPEPSLCALAGCTDPLPPDPVTCAGTWIYFTKNKVEWANYLFYIHTYAVTAAHKKCNVAPYWELGVNAERIEVKLVREAMFYEPGPGTPPEWRCDNDEVRGAWKYNAQSVSKTWNYTRPGGSGSVLSGAVSLHWVDYHNWHHFSVRSTGNTCGN